MECSDKEWQHCRVEKMGCEGCIYNEKTADEMFEEMGLKKKEEKFLNEMDETHYIKYSKRGYEKEIVFQHKTKTLYKFGTPDFSMQELQAIYKKCEELRMDKKIMKKSIICTVITMTIIILFIVGISLFPYVLCAVLSIVLLTVGFFLAFYTFYDSFIEDEERKNKKDE